MSIKDKIRNLATDYSKKLKNQIKLRMEDMKNDDTSHFMIYRVLGINLKEGQLIDEYQNKGRFLYKYAGSFLENSAKLCFLEKFPKSGSVKIKNTLGKKPKTFEIDCLVHNYAMEIKWRDATTDGDHITKEHTRISAISDAGFIPVRVMFYYPNREQAKKIQLTLQDLYKSKNGEYYFGQAAWDYLKKMTGVDLYKILEDLADENERK